MRRLQGLLSGRLFHSGPPTGVVHTCGHSRSLARDASGSKFSDLMSCIDIWLAFGAFMPLVLRKPCQPPLVVLFLRFQPQAFHPVAQRLMIREAEHLGCSSLAVTCLLERFSNVVA